jgi:hypothetical protein
MLKSGVCGEGGEYGECAEYDECGVLGRGISEGLGMERLRLPARARVLIGMWICAVGGWDMFDMPATFELPLVEPLPLGPLDVGVCGVYGFGSVNAIGCLVVCSDIRGGIAGFTRGANGAVSTTSERDRTRRTLELELEPGLEGGDVAILG